MHSVVLVQIWLVVLVIVVAGCSFLPLRQALMLLLLLLTFVNCTLLVAVTFALYACGGCPWLLLGASSSSHYFFLVTSLVREEAYMVLVPPMLIPRC